MRIAIAGDHTAVSLKEQLVAHVRGIGHETVDFGVFAGESVDYPLMAERAARAVADGSCDRGLLFCGTGQGMMMSANKVRGIRCAVCIDCYSAQMARRHNDANMMAFGSRVLGVELAKLLAETFLQTPFEGGRHTRRVDMIMDLERRMHGENLT